MCLLINIIMSSINLTTLKRQKESTDNVNSKYTFTDVAMDMSQDTVDIITKNRLYEGTKKLKKDLKVLHDEAAIANSIFYIVSTTYGQRPLLPGFGCNIRKFIGEPISSTVAKIISSTISTALKSWEPRINITSIVVKEDADNHEYSISIYVSIPKMGIPNINVFARLTNNGNIIRTHSTT